MRDERSLQDRAKDRAMEKFSKDSDTTTATTANPLCEGRKSSSSGAGRGAGNGTELSQMHDIEMGQGGGLSGALQQNEQVLEVVPQLFYKAVRSAYAEALLHLTGWMLGFHRGAVPDDMAQASEAAIAEHFDNISESINCEEIEYRTIEDIAAYSAGFLELWRWRLEEIHCMVRINILEGHPTDKALPCPLNISLPVAIQYGSSVVPRDISQDSLSHLLLARFQQPIAEHFGEAYNAEDGVEELAAKLVETSVDLQEYTAEVARSREEQLAVPDFVASLLTLKRDESEEWKSIDAADFLKLVVCVREAMTEEVLKELPAFDVYPIGVARLDKTFERLGSAMKLMEEMNHRLEFSMKRIADPTQTPFFEHVQVFKNMVLSARGTENDPKLFQDLKAHLMLCTVKSMQAGEFVFEVPDFDTVGSETFQACMKAFKKWGSDIEDIVKNEMPQLFEDVKQLVAEVVSIITKLEDLKKEITHEFSGANAIKIPGALRAVFSNAKACQKLPEILQQFFDNIEGTIVGLVEGLEQGYQALLDDEGHAVEDNQVPTESPRSPKVSQAVGDWWQTAFSTEFIQGTVVTHLRDSCDKMLGPNGLNIGRQSSDETDLDQIAELTDVEATEFSFKLRGACAKAVTKSFLLSGKAPPACAVGIVQWAVTATVRVLKEVKTPSRGPLSLYDLRDKFGTDGTTLDAMLALLNLTGDDQHGLNAIHNPTSTGKNSVVRL